jgi:hypothetical protein
MPPGPTMLEARDAPWRWSRHDGDDYQRFGQPSLGADWDRRRGS